MHSRWLQPILLLQDMALRQKRATDLMDCGFSRIPRSSMSWLGSSFALRTSWMTMPCWLADLMMQLLTYFWRFRQCHLNFMPFASALHAAVAFSGQPFQRWTSSYKDRDDNAGD